MGAPCLEPPQWSPDGNWLIFDILRTDESESGIWISDMSTELHKVEHFGGRNAIWHPDSEKFVYLEHGTDQVYGWLIETRTWEKNRIDLPDWSTLVAWLNEFHGP